MFTFFRVQLFGGRISRLKFPALDHIFKKREPQIDLHVNDDDNDDDNDDAFHRLHYVCTF